MIELPLMLASGNPVDHLLDSPPYFFGITKHVIFMAVSALFTFLIFSTVARRISGGATGGRFANFFEAFLLYIRDEMVHPFLGKDTNKFLPVIWTFFFLILGCNLLGLLPFGATATGNIWITAGLATCSFVIYHYNGIKRNGFVKYVKANLLVGPWFLWILMIPIEIFGHVVRPCALAIRLFANMVGGHVLLGVILSFAVVHQWGDLAGVVKPAVTLVSVGAVILLNLLELLVATIQAFVFAFLTTVFLSLSLHPEH